MSNNNNTTSETVGVVEQSTVTTAPIHEVTELPTTIQSTPMGKLLRIFLFCNILFI